MQRNWIKNGYVDFEGLPIFGESLEHLAEAISIYR